MNHPTVRVLIFSLAALIGLFACKSSFVIDNVNFAQPVETVLQPDEQNMVNDMRYAVRFSVTPLLERENMDRIDYIHLIRDRDGLYYVTAAGFSTVYLFISDQGTLKAENEIDIPGGPVESPAFNQRGDYIELIDLSTGTVFRITNEGLTEEEGS